MPLLQAFTRCAQQEPDNGEAWNNLAAIHLQLQRPAEAFNALSEAVKVKRDSWQTWGNYAQAAAQTGHWLQAARGVLQVSSAGGCLQRGATGRPQQVAACRGLLQEAAQQVAACRGVLQVSPAGGCIQTACRATAWFPVCGCAAVGGQAWGTAVDSQA